MRRSGFLVLFAVSIALAVAMRSRSGADGPQHAVPPSASGDIVVGLCDGVTSAEIPGVKEGQTPTKAQARDVADRLMAEWRRRNPKANWQDPTQVAQSDQQAPGHAPPTNPDDVPPPPAAGSSVGRGQGEREGAARDAKEAAKEETRGSTSPGQAAAGGATPGAAGGLPAAPQGELQTGHTYGAFSDRDEKIWAAETQKFVKEGHRVFHDANALGSTNAVSCDMCHPDGTNTHPETYPKFQSQLGRVALLRDMINWCIQNPSRGKPLADDDPKLKAIEAYILAQRKGVALDFGKH
jgi:thiosulfate dehydrogenase